MSSSNAKDARVPLIVKPTHYDLSYTRIDLVHHSFEGTVDIQCTAVKTVDSRVSITLNTAELQLFKATLEAKDSEKDAAAVEEAEEFRYNARNETCAIVFGESSSLKEGTECVLKINFIGVLNDQMRGLYRSTYVGLDGETRTMATTQFEATDARRAFPCFDEPALKATFQLTVNIPAELTCISNTPMTSTFTSYQGKTAMKKITYQKTPKMSTYLLALVVGEFDGISQTSNHIVTTVYTVPGKADQAEFCLDVAVRSLDLYQELFHVKYPLVKSDLLAIPDFAAGAMENWGCITYREAKVLVKPNATSESTKRGIARTVCHEVAHQWFGNLVTPDFWTQLWLKEGVARYMEFVGIDALFPEWKAWTEFVQSVYGLAQSLDAMKSSHPVEVEVHHPDEISEIFDSISYAKGACIIRMISSHIGKDRFFEGLRVYLTRHAYGNAVTNDFWRALEESSGVPVVDIMRPWTLEVGYPILVLSDDGTLKTSRFLSSGPEEGQSTQWPIPVTAKVEGLDEIQGPWVINGPHGDESDMLLAKISEWTSAGKWFKLNVDQTGFFRVAYTDNQWHRLSNIMSPDGPLSVSDRLGIISDSFATGMAGYSPIVDALDLIQGFGEHETADFVVWQELSENLSSLASLFRSEPFFEKLQSFLRKIYSAHMARLGWCASAGEASRTGTLRATLIAMMGIANDSEVLKEAFDRFMAYKEDRQRSPIPGDLQKSIFRCALRHDEATVYTVLKEIAEDPDTFPEEQRNCLSVMGCVKDSQRHTEMLDYVFFSGNVRMQDISFPLASLSTTTDEGGRAAWKFIKSNFSRLSSKLGPMWGPCVGLCCRGLLTLEEAEEVENFFSDPSHEPGSAKRRLTQALEIVKTKAKRCSRDRGAVEEFLRNQ